ncbi:MlaD family protein [Thermodesulfobacteriota bacterium]
MSKQASKTMIGGFVVGAIALLFAGIMIFGSGRFFSETHTFVMYFEGSVKGLEVGGPVMFRGVKIGTVRDIKLRANYADMTVQIPVFVEIDGRRIDDVEENDRELSPEDVLEDWRENGLRAQLKMRSLITGQMMVELDFRPDTPLNLMGDGEVPEIPTIPSGIEELAKIFEEAQFGKLFKKLMSAVEAIETVVNSPEMQQLPGSVNATLEETRQLVRNMDEKVTLLAASIDETSRDYGNLARSVDGRVEPLATGFEETIRDFQTLARNLDAQIDKLATSVQGTADATTETMVKARDTLSEAEWLISEDSITTQELITTLRELSAAAHAIRVLAEYIEQHPEALIQGKHETEGK